MFWNNEFLNTPPSVFDALLQSEATTLSDILFQEDLLQELKTSNLTLIQYLIKPEVINELVDNITKLTEKDCYDKLLYSKVHAAYISCEILTAGSQEILDALVSQKNLLPKIISCLVRHPEDEEQRQQQQQLNSNNCNQMKGTENEVKNESNKPMTHENDPKDFESDEVNIKTPGDTDNQLAPEGSKNDEAQAAVVTPIASIPSQSPGDSSFLVTASELSTTNLTSTSRATIRPIETVRIVPQKATLVGKLITDIHSNAAADLSCPITKNMESFSELIQVLVNNIDVSGSFEMLSTFINRTNPPELRYVFCEILSRLNFVFSLINVMTLSNVEDKQRNACQLLCDIIVTGRQEAEQTSLGTASQDMLVELMESRVAVHLMLKQMFAHNHPDGREIDVLSLLDRFKVEKEKEDEMRKGFKIRQDNEVKAATKSDNTVATDSDDDETYGLEMNLPDETFKMIESCLDALCKSMERSEAATRVNHVGDDKPKHDDDYAGGGSDGGGGGGVELKFSSAVIWRPYSETESRTQPIMSPNTTAIVCGMKVLQTLVEHKAGGNQTNNSHMQDTFSLVANTVDRIEGEIADSLADFHELLLNPPKQEPIKTTFGVIQKPLGYIRLEVVNLIRALLGTCSPVIIKKLVELKTMKIIIDLFVEYSWNNLLHTQVEQAVHLIIRNCRSDEDFKYQVDMEKHTSSHTNHQHNNNTTISSPPPSSSPPSSSNNNTTESSTTPEEHELKHEHLQQQPLQQTADDLPSLALLSQLLNECDLIGRLLLPNKNGAQANFGHIIQMINSIAISCDLDTIKDHLNEMKDKRPELHARWTNFVNVDVASFKAISLYYDVQSVSAHGNNNYGYLQKRNLSSNDEHRYYMGALSNSSPTSLANNTNDDKVKILNGNGEDRAYYDYIREVVMPSINVDVLPRPRRF